MSLLAKISKKIRNQGTKIYPHDSEYVKNIIANEDFPFLISFPRTGSHWMRVIMEYYFKRPSLTRIFKYRGCENYTCYHTHDFEDEETLGNIKRKNVIYMYRNAPETIYSQLQYSNEDINDKERINFWVNMYGNHLKKWILEDDFTKKKLILKYENLQNDSIIEFKKVCQYFNEPFNEKRLKKVIESISKEKVKNSTNDVKVVDIDDNYAKRKKSFLKDYSGYILNEISKVDSRLPEIF